MSARRTAGLVGAAGLIAAVTVLARVVGLGRWLAFSHSVGATCTGTAYSTANQLPNVLYEVVAGGALSAAVVPLLARPMADGDRDQVDRTASALLTWAFILLVPVALLLAVVAGPLVTALEPDGDCSRNGLHALAVRMLLVFAPQVVLYGIGVVLTGVLQAQRRFAWAAAAPLLSSVVVIGSYLWFGAIAGDGRDDLSRLSRSAELVLSVGTTLGVAALSLPLVLPVRRAGVRLRATFAFPPGVAQRARRLAAAGVATLGAQQLAVVVTLWLANRRGGPAALNVYQYVQAVYVLPYAVLAVPLATSAFPRLAEHAGGVDDASYASTLARSTRLVVLAALAGTALLVATAPAVGAFFSAIDAGRSGSGAGTGAAALAGMATALTAFAPGLWGFALIAHLGRALYADGRSRWAAGATAAGWLVAAVGSVVVVLGLVDAAGDQPRRTLLGLGLASTAGMTVAGALLIWGVVRTRGGAGLSGLLRAQVVALVGAVLALAAGRVVTDAVVSPGVGPSLAAGLLGAAVAAVVLVVVVAAADRGDARALLARIAGGRR
ncbi:MAG: murein biosynthesis integral membrane protein MurJ [Actinomycetales bacterium]